MNRNPVSVAIVVPTYNDRTFLQHALESIAAQTRPPDEVIVVDDGSDETPQALVEMFPGVRLIRRPNGGLGAARNTGLQAAKSTYIVFLDADDVLEAGAISAGLEAMKANPDAGFVYGGYQIVDDELNELYPRNMPSIGPSARTALVRGNFVGAVGAVMFDREKLAEIGGFDAGLRYCEDYDAYLRMSDRWFVGCHTEPVLKYRRHQLNMSHDLGGMFQSHCDVLDQNIGRGGLLSSEVKASSAGKAHALSSYCERAWLDSTPPIGMRWRNRLQMFRIGPLSSLAAIPKALIYKLLPDKMGRVLAGELKRFRRSRQGPIHFGQLGRLTPFDSAFGFARGTPVDRYFIDRFVERHASEISGHVLEFADDAYSRRYGSGVTRIDVAGIEGKKPGITIVGDICEPGILPAEAFDCILAIQTLQFVADLSSAVANLCRALRPGGTLIATVPVITPLPEENWQRNWLFTPPMTHRIFDPVFGNANVSIEAMGNVFAATCFLYGIAQEEIDLHALEYRDPTRPVILGIRARKAA